ncbi:MAG: hypothetical protein JWP74_3862 [Marmoricola sp.]|nr:hypothetical protein [Marmoricola sp.]
MLFRLARRQAFLAAPAWANYRAIHVGGYPKVAWQDGATGRWTIS